MSKLKGGVIGCGFFSKNHLNAWNYLDGAEIVALCDRDQAKARALQIEFGIDRAFDDPGSMLQAVDLDFVDIVTQPASHPELVRQAAHNGVPVICQKPMASNMSAACEMVETASSAQIPFMVHENFRWQAAMRALKKELDDLGDIFFGRISFRSGFDVFSGQPYLAEDPRFIIYDLGIHLLDLARYFLGDVARLHCSTHRVNPRIKGEDVATIMLEMKSGATCIVDVSYASKVEVELFPQTLAYFEGSAGTTTLRPNYQVSTVKETSVAHSTVHNPSYIWSSSSTEAIQHSVVEIQRHWISCLEQRREPETSGSDNLKTLELVFGAYDSAENGRLFIPK